ncbi:cytochrome P450 [Streptomyces daliensis]|uniref:Cytochrome P450 n=1 Tax=Streptomyces daliensis TaxID=299421 RepID=A0A8T4IIS4_9ACTN|nr:cytochrome P450 [Streptomyces daliensis]
MPDPLEGRRDADGRTSPLARVPSDGRAPLDGADGPGRHDWVATGRDEVRAVLADERFSTRPPADTDDDARGLSQPGNPLQCDPPEHTRLRRMLTPEFTLRRARGMEPLIERIVEERLDVMERAGRPADLMRHFAWPVPGLVGCSLLGIPRDDQPDLARNMILSRRPGHPRKLMLAAGNAFDGYLTRFVARKRRDPSAEDLISTLIREHGTEVDDAELVGFCAALLAAGLENMSGTLGLGTLALLRHRDQLDLLRRRPELMDQAVEEILRYATPVPIASPRTALADVPVAGQVVGKGEIVACALAAANGSRAHSAEPQDFDITRENATHVAFGHGVHFCVGAALVRSELRIAFAKLVDRFPGLRLAVPPEELLFVSAPQRGVEALPVTW